MLARTAPTPTKRQDPRAPKLLGVTYSAGSKPRRATTGNVSRGGLLLRTDAIAAPGAGVEGHLQTKTGPIPFFGVVTWAKKGNPRKLEPGMMGVRLL